MRRFLPIGAILVSLAAALAWEAGTLSFTADEPSHLAAGVAYWRHQDFLYPSDTPPLTRIIGGWVPLAMGAMPIDRTRDWPGKNAYPIGQEMIAGPDGPRLIFCSRLPFLLFPLGLVFITWLWARELFGETIAIVLAGCAALEPTILGHGALIKSDVPAASMALLFAWCAWRYWRAPGWRTGALLTGSLVLAVLAKFTLLALVPVAFVLVAIRGPRIIGPILVVAAVYLGIILGYQLQLQRMTADEMDEIGKFAFHVEDSKLFRWSRLLPWPPQFTEGLKFIGAHDHYEGFSAYMLGHRIEGAQPWYFPLAWLLKFPIALQLLTLGGIAAAALRKNRTAAKVLIWGLAACFAALTIRSHMHIGFRHFLPVLPFLILGGGFALEWAWQRRATKIAALALTGWLAIASLWIYPNGISYFNEWIGGPSNGWRYLADSNVDWGQNFRKLGRYVRDHRITKLHTALFGLDAVDHYLPAGVQDPIDVPFDPKMAAPAEYKPEPGTYAISVNMLLGYLFPPASQDFFRYFKAREPDARAGYSIHIYEVR